MKAWVDADKCQGHTLCAMAAGEFFVLSDEDGHATALSEHVPAELEAKVRLAAGGCPEQAIVIEA